MNKKIYITPSIDCEVMANEDMICESAQVDNTPRNGIQGDAKQIDFSDDSDWGF